MRFANNGSESESGRSGVFRFLKASENGDETEQAEETELEFAFNFAPNADGIYFAQDTYKLNDKVTGLFIFYVQNNQFFTLSFVDQQKKDNTIQVCKKNNMYNNSNYSTM